MRSDDQRTEGDRRADPPAPKDAFEADFASHWLFSRVGVAVVGGGAALPGVLVWLGSGEPAVLVLTAVGFLLMAGWMIAIIGLVRWLVRRRSWPVVARRTIVGFALPGGPVAFMLLLLLLATLTSAH